MKRFVFVAAFPLIAVCFFTAVAQDRSADLKHVTLVPQHGKRGDVVATALEVEKGTPYPSIAHLKGNVQIRANGFILRADQADYDEESGEIKASGSVTITPGLRPRLRLASRSGFFAS